MNSWLLSSNGRWFAADGLAVKGDANVRMLLKDQSADKVLPRPKCFVQAPLIADMESASKTRMSTEYNGLDCRV